MFTRYHEELCRLECAMKKTMSDLQCVPWDVPFPFKEGETVVCPGSVAKRFKKALNNHTTQGSCPECQWPLCTQTTYIVKVSSSQYIKIVY